MNALLNNTKKPVVFALSGGIGCFLFALLAELFLLFTAAGTPVQHFCLTLDVSGSMAGDKMDEIKQAAKTFVDKQNRQDEIALVIFSSVGKVLVPFTTDKNEVKKHIDDLLPYGGTNFEDAMDKTNSVFGKDKSHSAVLLFTDGAPSEGDAQKAVDIAYQLRKDGVRVFCVSTPDGDLPYLADITGKDDRVIAASDGKIGEAFIKAEDAMKSSLMGSGSSSTKMSFVRSCGWAMFLAVGIALFLVAVQNHFLQRQLLPSAQLTPLIIGSIVAGFVSGFIGECSHQVFDVVHLGILGQVVGWTVLGAALALGMTYFIPNLNKKKAIQFGAGGGLLGSIVFLIFSTGTEIGGRLIGAFILGAIIGLLVAFVEMLFRNAWLMVMYDPRNVQQVNLGTQFVTVGGGSRDIVFINGAEPSAGTFQMSGNKITYKTKSGTQTLNPGDRVSVNGVELVVCSKEVLFAASKFYPMRMCKVPH